MCDLRRRQVKEISCPTSLKGQSLGDNVQTGARIHQTVVEFPKHITMMLYLFSLSTAVLCSVHTHIFSFFQFMYIFYSNCCLVWRNKD